MSDDASQVGGTLRQPSADKTDPIHVIDSHTAGEPTRVVIAGGPPLGHGPLDEQLERFRTRFDHYRTAVVKEPRGSDVLVGAMLCAPSDPDCLTGVIFFNNVGYLGMCGHGLIGVVETLRHQGKIDQGVHRFETPVGVVNAELNSDRSVSIVNVPSYRSRRDVRLDVDGVGTVVGDVAWGGNWFFLVKQPTFTVGPESVRRLQEIAAAIRNAVNHSGFAEVDHVELFDDPSDAGSGSRNFVLCPGLEYDRSPCGTGTSAKMACLAADGVLSPGEDWIQAGVLGTTFRGRYEWGDQSKGIIKPRVTGRAFVTSESKLIIAQRDPFRWGISGE